MQNLSIPAVALKNVAQWRTQYESLFQRVSELHQAGKIDAMVSKEVTDYLDKLNQALKDYFSLTTLPKQTEQLQSLLAELQIFADAQKDSPVISELLAELKAMLIATREKLLKPMEIEKLPPEILNRLATKNFTSRQTLNLAQCSHSLFFGDAGLSFLAKCKRLQESGKFKLIVREGNFFLSIQNKLFVWGDNKYGQLGLGDNVDRSTPVEFDLSRLQLAPEDSVAQIVTGGYLTILLTQQGRCFVWGANHFGQLGLGDNVNRNVPVELNLAPLQIAPRDGVAQVVAGEFHTILLTQQGRCFVWGANNFGQLGLGDNDNRTVPVELNLAPLQIAPRDGVAQVVAGELHTILLTRQGRCFVWGNNYRGQLGLGYNSRRVSTPTEVFYPHLKELKNLWSALQKEDLATLASLACDKANYGHATYQLIVKRLASENIKTRLSIISIIQASPWHQPHLVTKLLPFASLYEPLIETLKVKFSKEQQFIAHALAKLLDIFNYFIDKEASAELVTRQEDFVELLKTLCQGGLQNSDAFSKYLEKTAASRHLKNFRFTLLDTSFDLPLPNFLTPYFNVRQELLTEAKQQPKFLSHLTTAADILLQGLNAATEADGMAYTLRKFLQSKQQPSPTLLMRG